MNPVNISGMVEADQDEADGDLDFDPAEGGSGERDDEDTDDSDYKPPDTKKQVSRPLLVFI